VFGKPFAANSKMAATEHRAGKEIIPVFLRGDSGDRTNGIYFWPFGSFCRKILQPLICTGWFGSPFASGAAAGPVTVSPAWRQGASISLSLATTSAAGLPAFHLTFS
jgi:hypothetical protein